MGHISVEQLENHVTANEKDNEELQIVLSELCYRSTKRAMQLKSLVERLIGENNLKKRVRIGPLFD